MRGAWQLRCFLGAGVIRAVRLSAILARISLDEDLRTQDANVLEHNRGEEGGANQAQDRMRNEMEDLECDRGEVLSEEGTEA